LGGEVTADALAVIITSPSLAKKEKNLSPLSNFMFTKFISTLKEHRIVISKLGEE
jgi:hypothetical protein